MNQVGVYIPEQNFTLLGMAGLITGVMHAPLTGIFLIAELTGGYQLFMPLMIVCISSLLTISIFESHSIYALRPLERASCSPIILTRLRSPCWACRMSLRKIIIR